MVSVGNPNNTLANVTHTHMNTCMHTRTHTHTLAGIYFKFFVSRTSVLEGSSNIVSACVYYTEEGPPLEDVEINIATQDDSAQGDDTWLLYLAR